VPNAVPEGDGVVDLDDRSKFEARCDAPLRSPNDPAGSAGDLDRGGDLHNDDGTILVHASTGPDKPAPLVLRMGAIAATSTRTRAVMALVVAAGGFELTQRYRHDDPSPTMVRGR